MNWPQQAIDNQVGTARLWILNAGIMAAAVLLIACGMCAGSEELPSHYAVKAGLENDMVATYLDCFRQRENMRLLAENHPELAPDLKKAQEAFDARFGPSIDMIDHVLSRKAAWETRKSVWMDEIRKQAAAAPLARESVEAAIAQARATVEGRVDSPVLKVLLTFDPAFVKSPVEQFNHGYVIKYNSKSSALAYGVDFDVQLPMSWKWKPATNPSMLINAVSANGNGADTIIVAVRKMEKIELDDRAAIAKLLDAGHIQSMKVISLNDRPALQMETDQTVEKEGSKWRLRGRMYAVPVEGRLVSVQCFAVAAGPDDAQVNARFESFEPLFEKISSSLVIRTASAPTSRPVQSP